MRRGVAFLEKVLDGFPSIRTAGGWVPAFRGDDPLKVVRPHPSHRAAHSANGRHGKRRLKKIARLRLIKLSHL
jgi:hypothetical protein